MLTTVTMHKSNVKMQTAIATCFGSTSGMVPKANNGKHEEPMPQIKTKLTRNDCTRDNVKVSCPNASTLGFGRSFAKRGHWLEYEIDNIKCIGRAIGRVICEGKIYIEVAQASLSFSCVHVRWINPGDVRESRRNPPRSIFTFLSQETWEPESIFPAMEYGISDMKDQMSS